MSTLEVPEAETDAGSASRLSEEFDKMLGTCWGEGFTGNLADEGGFTMNGCKGARACVWALICARVRVWVGALLRGLLDSRLRIVWLFCAMVVGAGIAEMGFGLGERVGDLIWGRICIWCCSCGWGCVCGCIWDFACDWGCVCVFGCVCVCCCVLMMMPVGVSDTVLGGDDGTEETDTLGLL